MTNIRNFAIIAHIDHGKSTLADRLLEITGTISKEKLIPQYLDRLGLERERGITIKMQPVRMLYKTRINADARVDQRGLLYGELTYQIRRSIFNVHNKLGSGFKENIYQNALTEEFTKQGLFFDREKNLEVIYEGKKVGSYRPDFVIDGKIILEIKALPFIGEIERKQVWHYLKGSSYRLALLVNFGNKKLEIKRVIYDNIRDDPRLDQHESAQVEYILNLIDTPGHADFTYEVSRALKAVEGVILLVDAAKGVQAQTVFNFKKAIKQKLIIIPVINKIDLQSARVERVQDQIIKLFAEYDLLVERSEILGISAKTGQGVEELLRTVIAKIPSPAVSENLRINSHLSALIFDSFFDSFKGVLAYVRVFNGEVKQGDAKEFASSKNMFHIKEVGVFIPDFKPMPILKAGDIGYIATGIKEAGMVKIGDTICQQGGVGLEGFFQPQPKVFASFYPLEEGEFEGLRSSLEKLHLTDPAISFERTESPLLGRGFRCGFLGKLHMEIIAARLDDELDTEIVIGAPSVAYFVDGAKITSPIEFPEYVKDHNIKEPWVKIEIFSPSQYLGKIFDLLQNSDGIFKETVYLDENNIKMTAEMSLDQIVTKDFYDTLKSISQGFASAEYEPLEYRKSKKVRLDILVAGEYIDAFSKIIARHRVYEEASRLVKKLKEVLPKAQFTVSIQARVEGRVIAREDIPALKKAVTEPLYGGDWSRKKKLLVKQREGKKRMRQFGKVQIPKEVFLKII